MKRNANDNYFTEKEYHDAMQKIDELNNEVRTCPLSKLNETIKKSEIFFSRLKESNFFLHNVLQMYKNKIVCSAEDRKSK